MQHDTELSIYLHKLELQECRSKRCKTHRRLRLRAINILHIPPTALRVAPGPALICLLIAGKLQSRFWCKLID